MNMNCDGKTTLKLASNIIVGKNNVGFYIPIELKPKEYKDVRMAGCLSERQKRQSEKQLFWTDNVKESKERYPDRKENQQKCKDCEFRDICF